MKSSKPPRKAVSALELMNQLKQDPRYLAQTQQAQRRLEESMERQRRAVGAVIDDLKHKGFHVESLDELRRSRITYRAAIPVLLEWLPLVTDPGVKESIVRTLSVPWARPTAALPLIEAFRGIPDPGSGLKWAIGNALAVIANEGVFDEISELVRDKQHGKAREMLAVALANMENPRTGDLLIELLDDDQVAGHALIAIGKRGMREARPHIQRFLNHPSSWIRKEAQKALKKTDKLEKHR